MALRSHLCRVGLPPSSALWCNGGPSREAGGCVIIGCPYCQADPRLNRPAPSALRMEKVPTSTGRSMARAAVPDGSRRAPGDARIHAGRQVMGRSIV